jgi:hypothetical protein
LTCMQHTGGYCQQFPTLAAAQDAEAQHRQVTGHTETSTAPGLCP